MRIVFWQNCMSPHQIPYIVHLLDDERVDEVVLVAGETVSGARKAMGWNVIEFQGLDRCKVYIRPHDQIIESLLERRQADSYHLFSGIRADEFVFQCLRKSLSYSLKRGIITERPNTYDFKRDIENARPYWLHRIRFFLQDRKYARHIQYVFAMGNEAVSYFQSLGQKWSVFPFCYCTASGAETNVPFQDDRLPQYLYCGSLSSWKSPLTIVRAISRMDVAALGTVKMIGEGPLHRKLEKQVKDLHLTEKVSLLGTKPQTEVPMYMRQSDIFILPSVYDGWGAVVNEALQAGCYVLCSDACGASDLLKDNRLGKVFHHGDAQQLADCMTWCNRHIDEIRKDRCYRQEWAESHISGKVVARYMIDCLTGIKARLYE